MESNQRTFKEFTAGARTCLNERLRRSSGTQRHYIVLWNRVKKYMDSREICFLDPVVCDDFLEHEYAERDFNNLSKRDRDAIKAVEVLKEYIQSGTLVPKKEVPVFNGPIGRLMTRYFANKVTLRLANHTLDEYEQQLFRFLVFLNRKNITEIRDVNQAHILLYLKGIDTRYSSLAHLAIRILRDFFKYLYGQGLLDIYDTPLFSTTGIGY